MTGDEEDRVETRPFPTLREARYSQSLERGLAILGCFTPAEPVLGIAELAERLSMSRPTTHRYVTTLVSLGYLEQEASRKYRLGLAVTDLGMAALNATGLPTHAHPYMEQLSSRSGHTVDLGVLDGTESLLIDRARGRGGRGRAEPDSQIGTRQPAYCTSTGKILLAHLPLDQQSKLISGMELIKHGPKTITSEKALNEELELAREEGFAVADEELVKGACAIAAPIREDSGDVIAALSIVAHRTTIDSEELIYRFAAPLITTAEKISARLGWRESA